MFALQYRFLEPLDVLFLRGNKLFGDPGSFGESLVPPWPSAAAGALRSLILSAEGVDLPLFARSQAPHPALGTPADPGPFTVASFHLAQRHASGTVESLHAMPADLAVIDDGGEPIVRRLSPCTPAAGVCSSSPLEMLPVLAQQERSKPIGGRWLTQQGWARYLDGNVPRADELVDSAQLWSIDPRIGVGLDSATRRADDGKLFSAQAVAFKRDVGLVVGVSGAELPGRGMLRLGGDGRGAALGPADYQPAIEPLDRIASARRARIVLTSPGLFARGWLLPGADPDGGFELGGVRGRLVCAAVARAEVASGWDLALRQPKPAQRVAPAGSVYWIEDLDATAEALGKLAAGGLWDKASQNATRRAEGFNRFSFAVY